MRYRRSGFYSSEVAAMTDQFVLNVNDGVDTLHRNPGELCNTDDAVDRQNIDARTAAALITSGEARVCQHCIGPDQPEA